MVAFNWVDLTSSGTESSLGIAPIDSGLRLCEVDQARVEITDALVLLALLTYEVEQVHDVVVVCCQLVAIRCSCCEGECCNLKEIVLIESKLFVIIL